MAPRSCLWKAMLPKADMSCLWESFQISLESNWLFISWRGTGSVWRFLSSSLCVPSEKLPFFYFLSSQFRTASLNVSFLSLNLTANFFYFFFHSSAHFKHSLHSGYLLTSLSTALTPDFIVSFPHTRSNLLQITSLIHILACLFYEHFIERLDRGGRTAHIIAQGGKLLENGRINCFYFMFLGSE